MMFVQRESTLNENGKRYGIVKMARIAEKIGDTSGYVRFYNNDGIEIGSGAALSSSAAVKLEQGQTYSYKVFASSASTVSLKQDDIIVGIAVATAGQSNAGRLTGAPIAVPQTIDGVYDLAKGSAILGSAGYTIMGSLLKKILHENGEDVPIGFLDIAQGGTSVAHINTSMDTWQPDAPATKDGKTVNNFYNKAFEDLNSKTGGRAEVILWLQGESDAPYLAKGEGALIERELTTIWAGLGAVSEQGVLIQGMAQVDSDPASHTTRTLDQSLTFISDTTEYQAFQANLAARLGVSFLSTPGDIETYDLYHYTQPTVAWLAAGLAKKIAEQILGHPVADLRQEATGSFVGGDVENFVLGIGGANTMIGGSERDVFRAAEGDDSISGGGGNDLLSGGGDDDTVFGGAGDDNVFGNIGNDVLFGDEGDDLIEGGYGDDSMQGGIGDDTIKCGYGADTIDGGLDTDTIDFLNVAEGVIVNLKEGWGTISGLSSNGSRYASIENVICAAGSDTVIGSDADNELQLSTGDNYVRALAGNDTIFASGGKDTIYAGVGDDIIYAGAGADLIDGGAGFDRLDYSASADKLTINLQKGTGTGGYAAGDIISGIEAVYGSSVDDSLVGDAKDNLLSGNAGADTLNGGAGADTLIGGKDGDQLIGGSGRDMVDYNFSGLGVTINLKAGTASGGDAANDVLSGIEDITGSKANDSLTGSDAANQINGNAGNDNILGLGGADLLYGNAGQDTIDGGLSADTLYGGDNPDQLFGNDGDDSLVGDAGNDIIDGGNGNDIILGLGDNDKITGGIGDDVIDGGEGNDTILGENGADRIVGGIGDDNIDGGSGDDIITGDDGANKILGGAGNDDITAGRGADTIIGGADIDYVNYLSSSVGVTAYLSGQAGVGGDAAGDLLTEVENLVGSLQNDVLFGDAGANILRGYNGNDSLSGYADADTLMGGAGADTLEGGLGADSLVGGAGADVFVFKLSELSRNDVIQDFQSSDIIRITGAASFAFDPNPNQTPAVGFASFKDGYLYINTNAGPEIEGAIRLAGGITLNAGNIQFTA